jgi:hypothetical protein
MYYHVLAVGRCLVIVWPSGPFKFMRCSTLIASVCLWLASAVVALLPFLNLQSTWHDVFAQTGVCIPLPLTTAAFPYHGEAGARSFVSGVLLAQCALAGAVVVSQFLQRRVLSRTLTFSLSPSRLADISASRRLSTLSHANALTWAAAAVQYQVVTGATDSHVTDDVHAAVFLVVTTCSAAFSPVLLYVSVYMEKGRQERQQRVHKMLLSQLGGRHKNKAVK